MRPDPIPPLRPPGPRPAEAPSFVADKLMPDIERALRAMVARHAVPIPPYPAIALRLDNLVRRESYGLPEVVRLVTGEPTLAADLLRCANSSAAARRRPSATWPSRARPAR